MSRDRGSATIELAIITPAAIAFLVVVMMAGRLTLAVQATDSAAYDAARSASLARTPGAAAADGVNAAEVALRDQRLRCQGQTAVIDTSGFGIAPGNPATVRADVSCDVRFTDLIVPGWNSDWITGVVTVRARFVSPLDTYRSRS